jgi:hypothetical protein
MLLAVLLPRAALEKHATSIAAECPEGRGWVATTPRLEASPAENLGKITHSTRKKIKTASSSGSRAKNDGVPKVFLEKLWPYCKMRLVQMRGYHVCEFCDLPVGTFITCQFQGEEIKLGSAEIRVFGSNGRIFASPDLIFHYVRDHHYLPPESFIQAVLAEPGPDSQDYLNRLRDFSLLK